MRVRSCGCVRHVRVLAEARPGRALRPARGPWCQTSLMALTLFSLVSLPALAQVPPPEEAPPVEGTPLPEDATPPATLPAAEEPATADAAPKTEDLTPIEDLDLEELLNRPIVAATGMADSIRRVPSVVTVYTRTEIQRLGARNLMDLLRLTPGYVELADLNQRNLATRGVFGPTVQHVLVLIDGHRINDTTGYAASPDWISLDYAERVEIVRGPGSSVYGANAFTGVINVVTREGWDMGTRVRVEAGEYNTIDASAQYGYSAAGMDLLLSASVRRSDGYKYFAPANEDLPVNIVEAGTAPQATAGIMRINGYDPSYNLFMKLKLGKLTLRANAMASDLTLSRGQRGSLYDYRGEGTPSAQNIALGNAELFRPFRRDSREFAELVYELAPMPDAGLTFRLYGDHFRQELHGINMSRNLDPPEGWIVFWGGDNYRLGAEGVYQQQFQARFFVRAGVNAETTHATDFFLDHNDKGTLPDENPDRVDLIYGGRAAKDGYDTFGGAFASLTADVTKGLRLVAGGRFDYHEIYKSQLSPRLAVVYEPRADLVVKALYGQAYQAPAYIYRTGAALSGYQGRPDLEPQYIKTAEAQVAYEFQDSLYLDFNGYYNGITNFIKADFNVTPYSFQNRGELTVVGAESTVRVSVLRSRLGAMLNGALNFPLESATSANFLKDASLVSVPRYTLAGAITFSASRTLRFNLNGTYHGPVEFPIRSPAASNSAAYALAGVAAPPYDLEHEIAAALTLNAAASYNGWKDFNFQVSVHNLLDAADYAGGSVQIPYRLEGRVALFSVAYEP